MLPFNRQALRYVRVLRIMSDSNEWCDHGVASSSPLIPAATATPLGYVWDYDARLISGKPKGPTWYISGEQFSTVVTPSVQ